MQENLQPIVRANNHFAIDIFQELRKLEGNLFFSPYSISTALAMAYAGGRHDTEMQMAHVLHFPPDQQVHELMSSFHSHLNAITSRGDVQLDIANSLWPQAGYELLEQYLTLVKRYYGVSITSVDYRKREAACRIINAWIELMTHDKIRDMLQPDMIDALTRLVIVNAIYFKGDWARQFDPQNTHDAPFWVTRGENIMVPMMYIKHHFGYRTMDDLQMLQLPYRGGDLSMIILLPKQVDGLKDLEASLTPDKLAVWTDRLREIEVEVFLPKFEMTVLFRLQEILSSLGMVDAFGRQADFSGMESSKQFFIGDVLHQAYVVVNEEGTEAAAATAVVMRTIAMLPPPPVVKIDHPCLFLIRDQVTGSILFLGRLADPSA